MASGRKTGGRVKGTRSSQLATGQEAHRSRFIQATRSFSSGAMSLRRAATAEIDSRSKMLQNHPHDFTKSQILKAGSDFGRRRVCVLTNLATLCRKRSRIGSVLQLFRCPVTL